MGERNLSPSPGLKYIVLEFALKFEESIGILNHKTRLEEEEEDENIAIELPSHLSEGNVVDENTRDILDQMDPYDE